MPAKLNLINQTFGKLTVIEETSKRKNKSVVWKCLCECGNEIEASTKELRSDGVQMCANCGKQRNPTIKLTQDIVGKKFGFLTVLEKTTKTQNDGKILYKCQCDCGEICERDRTSLQRHSSPYCGQKKCSAHTKYHIGNIVNNRLILGYGDKNVEKRLYYKVKCLFCNKEYEATSDNLKNTISCGCQHSKGEFFISQILIENNIKFATQYTFSELGEKRYDFALLDDNNQPIRLIEFDGEQHFENNIKKTGWNTQEHYNKVSLSDDIKNAFALQKNIPLVRIPYWERNNLNLELLLGQKYEVKD